jgi:FkbM family methyltransferase
MPPLKKSLQFLKYFLPYGLLLAWQKQKARGAQKAAEAGKVLPVKEYHLSLTRSAGIWAFSQGGEDLLLRAYSKLDQKKSGFYVDIGAFHPVAGSNTKYFYDLGWRGLNVDPNPETHALFEEKRPRDVNLKVGVSDVSGTLDYYYFGANKSINTFNKALAHQFARNFNLTLPKPQKVSVLAIQTILDEHLPQGQSIDFLSIDVEGFEWRILKAWDFKNHPPRYILVEDLAMEGTALDPRGWVRLNASEQHQFLVAQGYHFLGKTALTLLYALAQESATN